MTLKIIVTNANDEVICEEVKEFTRWSHAERAAIKACKEVGGKNWHIKNVK